MNIQLTFILFTGIILIKIFWLYTETKYFKNRVNFNMFKTNSIEMGILILQILAAIYFPIPRTHLNKVIMNFGLIMYVLGMILALWARFTMNNVWGIPGMHASQQDKLITKGPFSFSRNPIYLGFLLLYFGFALAIGSIMFILRIPLAIYFYKSAKVEEKLLGEKFGNEYKKYKSNVPLFF